MSSDENEKAKPVLFFFMDEIVESLLDVSATPDNTITLTTNTKNSEILLYDPVVSPLTSCFS